MRKSSQRIQTITRRLYREEGIVRQRLLPLLSGPQRAQLGTQVRRDELSAAASSYVTTFVRDTIIAQVIELIPGLDAILPMYIAQVVKLIINQNIEYKKAQAFMAPYTQRLVAIDKLERLEIDVLTSRFRVLIQPQISKRAARILPATNRSQLSQKPTTLDIRPALEPAAAF